MASQKNSFNNNWRIDVKHASRGPFAIAELLVYEPHVWYNFNDDLNARLIFASSLIIKAAVQRTSMSHHVL